MIWTQNTPKENGYYWFELDSREFPPAIVKVSKGEYDVDFYVEWSGDEEGVLMGELAEGVWWAGPLMPPR